MDEMAEAIIGNFIKDLESLMEPHEGQVSYGNLRKKVSDWEDEKGKITNIAVIYETPGGSTNQINVTFAFAKNTFLLLNEGTGEEEEVSDPGEVLRRLDCLISPIPEKRRSRLRNDIEGWYQEGVSQADAFSRLNKLLHSDFKGAQITHEELQEATRYTIEVFRSQGDRADLEPSGSERQDG